MIDVDDLKTKLRFALGGDHPITFWKEAAQDLIECLGPGGYFPTAGEPKTTALREALKSIPEEKK